MHINTMDENIKGKNGKSINVLRKKIYCVGGNGKVYSNEVVKGLVSEFGVEVRLKNMTSVVQSIKHGGAIYDSNDLMVARWKTTEDPRLIIKEERDFRFTIDKKIYDSLSPGEYHIVFFINNIKIISGWKIMIV